MTSDQFRQLALSFPHTIASPHFERTAFKVVNKRIFATLHEESETANLNFHQLINQFIVSSIKKPSIP